MAAGGSYSPDQWPKVDKIRSPWHQRTLLGSPTQGSLPAPFFPMHASLTFLALLLALALADPAILPKPQQMTFGAAVVGLATGFDISIAGDTPGSVTDLAKDRYLGWIKTSSSGTLAKCLFNVQDLDEPLDLNSTEHYEILVSDDGSTCTVSASSRWGALRAMETLAQLVDETGVVDCTPVHIVDFPRFVWRGLMIDTSRHFLPVHAILDTIDTMAAYKMNVLHWHIVDAQSWPLDVPEVPDLTEAAYAPEATFTAKHISTVVNYAFARGVRVIPEVDIPGHAYGFRFGATDAVANCPAAYRANINNFPLNPSLSSTFDLVQAVFSYLSENFPDSYVHTGGDEPVFECWTGDPKIAAWMAQKGFSTGEQVYQYFYRTFNDTILPNLPKKKIQVCWEECLVHDSVPPQTVIQAWTNIKFLYQAVSQGHKAILSAGLYLDKQKPGVVDHYLWQDTWRDFYIVEPTNIPGHKLTPAEEALILGTEMCMWGETIANRIDLQMRVWPRAAAGAERQWSAVGVTDQNDALARMQVLRCRLAERGIYMGGLAPGFCAADLGI